jgi:hypothetical protein
MAHLALCRDFLPDYAALDKVVRGKVDELLPKFRSATHTGLHLEKINGARDPRARTIRVDRFWRGVVIAPDAGDTYLLLRVLPHDDAVDWVKRHTFSINHTTGALEIQDVEELAAVSRAVGGTPTADAALFEGRSDKEFTTLGIPAELVPVLRRLGSEEKLLALTSVMPPGQRDALLMMHDGLTVEQVWARLVADDDPGPVDTDDLEAALARPASQLMFCRVEGDRELRAMLDQPFSLWRTFLHPEQRRLAYQPTYNGPVRVSGGAGTGKTVVALHRARALAEQLPPGAPPILFTTFTRSLVTAIEEQVEVLAGAELRQRIEVTNADRLAYAIVLAAEGKAPDILKSPAERGRWKAASDFQGGAYGPAFLAQEWRRVILAQGITDRDGYLTARRPARGTRLNRRDRAEIWTIVERFLDGCRSSGQRTFLQLADDACGYLRQEDEPRFSHVIVDEAQDLHPAQWRLLRAAVPKGANDLFIVGDTQQRIYGNTVTLSAVDINVRGRSHHLRINYRTTHEILSCAVRLLTGESFDDLDGEAEKRDGYRSELRGDAPVVQGFASSQQELDGLVEAVQQWTAAGVQPEEIGVVARTGSLDAATAALQAAGVPTRTSDSPQGAGGDGGGVVLATMHGVKGLEFRCVAVIGASDDSLPLPAAVRSAGEDMIERERVLLQERCLLYVAATRARDALRISWSGEPSPFIKPMLVS